MKYIIYLATFTMSVHSACAQNIKLYFDYSNAEKTLELLATKDTTAVGAILELEATRTLLQKINMTETEARRAMLAALDSSPGQDNYQLGYIRRHAQELSGFISEIKRNERNLKIQITEALERYVPENRELSITDHFLLGGFSSGFTMGDAHHFYIGLHHYQNDLVSLTNTCIHELFHTIQQAHYDITPKAERLEATNEGLAYFYFMLANIFKEGTAEYVADISKLSGDTPHIKELKEHAFINPYRQQDIFYLIGHLLSDAASDPGQVRFGNLYSILMDWNWNNPGYFAGYTMMKALAAENDGGETLLGYLQKDPVYFFYDYIRLSEQNSDLPKFSARFKQVVIQLKDWIDAS